MHLGGLVLTGMRTPFLAGVQICTSKGIHIGNLHQLAPLLQAPMFSVAVWQR